MSSLKESVTGGERALQMDSQRDAVLVGDENLGAYDVESVFNPLSLERKSASVGNICPTCSKSFDRLYNLKVHLRKHTGETPYQCPIGECPKQFKWRSSMAHHVRAHHNGTSADITSVRVRGSGHPWRDTQPTAAFASPEQMKTLIAPSPPVVLKSPGRSGRKKFESSRMKPTQTIKKVVHIDNRDERRSSSVFNERSSIRDKTMYPHVTALQTIAYGSQELEAPDPDLDSVFGAFGDPLKEVNIEMPNMEADNRLLSMVSDILARGEGSYEPELERAMDTSISEDILESGMNFLAQGSDNVTDAEMECLAHSDGVLSTPDSNLSGSPGFKSSLTPPEFSKLP